MENSAVNRKHHPEILPIRPEILPLWVEPQSHLGQIKQNLYAYLDSPGLLEQCLRLSQPRSRMRINP